MPIIPLHAKTTAYGDGKPANLNSPAKSPVKTEAPAFTPTDTSIKTPPTQAESSGSATPTTLTPIESRKPAAPKTPSKAEPQRTVPKYSATASSWRSAAPTSVESHKPKSVPAPLPPSTSTNSRSQDPATSSFLPTADPREKYPFNLSKKPPAPALARDDVNGKGKAPETEQGEDGEAVKEEEEENAPEQSAKTGEELHAEESLRLEEELQMDALIRERFANRTPLPQDFMPKEYAMVDMIMEEATEREINLDEAWLLAFIMEMEDEQRKKYADDEHVDANDTSEDNANRETITLETSNEGNTNDDNSPPATPALTNGPSASSRDEDEPIDIWTEEWTDHN
jgi:hypothetical protein